MKQHINGAEGISSPTGKEDIQALILTNIAFLFPFIFQHMIMPHPSFKKNITIIIPEALECRLFCIGAAGTLHYMMMPHDCTRHGAFTSKDEDIVCNLHCKMNQ
eukprot:5502923-Ditylum_brightwellii.AAC.1